MRIRFIIHHVPEDTPGNESIFLSGNFCDWAPNDPRFIFHKQDNGTYILETDDIRRTSIEYKLTRGAWHTVECKYGGAEKPNRAEQINDGSTIYIYIECWADKIHSASEQVYLLHDAFKVPQLNVTCKLWSYLPYNYNFSKKDYPLYIMLNGEDSFDNYYANGQEWQIDKTLSHFHYFNISIPVFISIGHIIDYDHQEGVNVFSKGTSGRKYADFLIHTLLPYLKKTFRIKHLAEDVCIVANNKLADISLYMALQFPDLIGNIMLFSPQISPIEKTLGEISSQQKIKDLKIYSVHNAKEGIWITQMRKLQRQMQYIGCNNIQLEVKTQNSQHDNFYAHEFYNAYIKMNSIPIHKIMNYHKWVVYKKNDEYYLKIKNKKSRKNRPL